MSDTVIIRPQSHQKKTTYQVEFYRDGKRKRETKKTKADAIAFKKEIEEQIRRRKAIESLKSSGVVLSTPGQADQLKRMDIQSALESFYESKKAVVFDPKDLRSLQVEKYAYNLFGEFIVEKRKRDFVDEITLEDLEKLRVSLQKKKLKNATIVRKENSITAFLNYCVEHKWRTDNPANGLMSLPVVTPVRKTMRGTDYRQQIEDNLPEWCAEIFIVQGETIARNIEILRAKVEDVNWVTKEIRLVSAKGRHVHERFVPLTERAQTVLRAAIAKRKLQKRGEAEDLIFLNSRGRMVTSDVYCDVIKKTREKLKLPDWATAYVLRHDGLKELRRLKAHQSQISEIAGHRKAETTQHYMRGESDELRNVINLVDRSKQKAI